MKKSLLFSLLIVFSIIAANAQKENPINYLDRLPAIELDKSVIRSYRMTTDYYDFDLKRNLLGKRRIEGILTYEGDSAKWSDVYISSSKSLDGEFPKGKLVDFLQDFRYRPDENVLTTEFFRDNLPNADVVVMNLIWDALCFDALAYTCWDSLKLNTEFRAESINSEVKMADIGTFKNLDTRITWLGITQMNDEMCAILKYSVINNPLEMVYENTSISGRSHFWGEIYVSLSDKQIEYANLMEDVLTDVRIKDMENNIVGYTIRTITLTKTN